MSSGANIITAFIREVTTGVTPTSGVWDLLTRTNYGVKSTQSTADNDEIGGSRMAQGKSLTTVDVGAKFHYSQHDAFLASCFGAEWITNKLTMGDSRITFSLATFASDIGVAAIARGYQIGSMQIEIPADEDATVTATFAGLGFESKGDGTKYHTDPVDNAGKLCYGFKEVAIKYSSDHGISLLKQHPDLYWKRLY